MAIIGPSGYIYGKERRPSVCDVRMRHDENCRIVIGAIVLLVLIMGGVDLVGSWRIDRSFAGVDEKWPRCKTSINVGFDLVPNLVASVDNFHAASADNADRGDSYASARDRSKRIGSGGSRKQKPGAIGFAGGSALRQLNSFINVVVEQYPQIKGDQLYSDLMTQLEGTEKPHCPGNDAPTMNRFANITSSVRRVSGRLSRALSSVSLMTAVSLRRNPKLRQLRTSKTFR